MREWQMRLRSSSIRRYAQCRRAEKEMPRVGVRAQAEARVYCPAVSPPANRGRQ